MEFPSAGNHMIMQSFEPNAELFGRQAGMEMLGFPYNPTNPNPNPWQDDDISLSLSNPKGFHLSGSTSSHQQQLFMDDGSSRRFFQSQQLPYQLKRSKHLIPAQELLKEFCSLGGSSSSGSKKKEKKASQWEDGGPSSLYSMDIGELQKRKAKLLSMLEEVYRRYRRYCEQIRSVVSSFEAMAGESSATVYSALASKAMSRHFRCLRDGIMGQIQVTKTAMGGKEAVAPGTSKGETPRLKKLEQCLRQKTVFHQSQPWRPQRGLPERSVSVLRAWLFEHFLHPYPSDVDKHILTRQTGLSRSQVTNWFINARVRLWKPMVEEMYMEELKEEENPNPNPSSSQLRMEDKKPMPEQLLNDSDSLSSIINSRHRSDRGHPINSNNANANLNPNPNFGVVDLDFSAYTGSGVSLTLGLQQHDGGGMSLSFSPNSQHSLLFSTEHIDDSRPVQFSILDGEGQNLPYRNLMGAQLLHDLTG